MLQLSIRKIWPNRPQFDDTNQAKRFINSADSISYHLTSFTFLQSHKSRLLDFSYREDLHPVPDTGLSKNDIDKLFREQVYRQGCQIGEKGIWNVTENGKPTGKVLFIEIIEVNNDVMVRRHMKINQLVKEYMDCIATEKLPGYLWFDYLLDAEEVHHYASNVFFQHWAGKDLDLIANPCYLAKDAVLRRAIAKAKGLQALRDLGWIVETIENGRNWEQDMASKECMLKEVSVEGGKGGQ